MSIVTASRESRPAKRIKAEYLVEAVVTVLAATCEEPPGAAQHVAGERGGAVVLDGLGVLRGRRRRQRAGQEVVHDALIDANLLHASLDDVEQQGYEPQQHQLCTTATTQRMFLRQRPERWMERRVD